MNWGQVNEGSGSGEPSGEPGSGFRQSVHNPDDIDYERSSGHHTLGKGPTQAAPGDHYHDWVGEIRFIGFPYAKLSIEDQKKYLQCNGAYIPAADYPELYAKIGVTYGSSGLNFRLPTHTSTSTMPGLAVIKVKP